MSCSINTLAVDLMDCVGWLAGFGLYARAALADLSSMYMVYAWCYRALAVLYLSSNVWCKLCVVLIYNLALRLAMVHCLFLGNKKNPTRLSPSRVFGLLGNAMARPFLFLT